jgi:hypothetical protein
METTPGTLSLDLEDDHFVLRREGRDLVTMSFGEVLALANAAPTYRQFIMSKMHDSAVFTTPVSKAGATWDALGEKILIQLEFEPNGTAIYEFSPQNCIELAKRLQQIAMVPPSFQSQQ